MKGVTAFGILAVGFVAAVVLYQGLQYGQSTYWATNQPASTSIHAGEKRQDIARTVDQDKYLVLCGAPELSCDTAGITTAPIVYRASKLGLEYNGCSTIRPKTPAMTVQAASSTQGSQYSAGLSKDAKRLEICVEGNPRDGDEIILWANP
jgi:hypothetical protein